MNKLPPMVSMARSPDKGAVSAAPSVEDVGPTYPYGLCLCLGQDELDKLGLDSGDVQVGDTIHLFAFAKVTSISQNETGDGKKSRIELQITDIASEDEDEENEEEDKREPVTKRLYG